MTQLSLGIPAPRLLPSSTVHSEWRPTPVNLLPAWGAARRVAVDIETCDPTLRKLGPGVRRGGRIVGYSFAIEDGPAHYVPVAHHGGDNVDEMQAFTYLRDQLRAFKGDIVGAGFAYDMDYICQRVGDDVFNSVSKIRDVLIAEPIIDQLQMNYNLEAVLGRYGLPGKDEAMLKAAAASYGIDPKVDLWRMPARYVGAYAEGDVRKPLQLLERQERALQELDCWKTWELESDVLPVLVRMRRRGVRVNLEKLLRIKDWCRTVQLQGLAQVHKLTGVQLTIADVNKNAAWARALEAAGYTLPRTAPSKNFPKGQPSVKNAFLKKIGELGKTIARIREFNKLDTTFCEQILEYQVNGRIHTTFRQLAGTKEGEEGGEEGGDEIKGTRWGRCSSVDPNMQYQPTRNDEYGAIWRDIYESDDPDDWGKDRGKDGEWVCSDWSQQEPRWAVHYAYRLNLPGAADFRQQYIDNPALDIHQALTDIINDPENLPRKIVKNFVNGRIYGMGDVKLCFSCNWPTKMTTDREGRTIPVPTDESRAKIKIFDDKVPWMRMLVREAAKIAETRGYVVTADGRRCNFPRLPNGKYDWTHKAFSRVGQGSAAGQAKLAMVYADRAGVPLQLAVHDEFDWTGKKWAKTVKEIQLTCLPCDVPHKVDCEVGSSWGKITKATKEEIEEWAA